MTIQSTLPGKCTKTSACRAHWLGDLC